MDIVPKEKFQAVAIWILSQKKNFRPSPDGVWPANLWGTYLADGKLRPGVGKHPNGCHKKAIIRSSLY
jgi:hypothetical protein